MGKTRVHRPSVPVAAWSSDRAVCAPSRAAGGGGARRRARRAPARALPQYRF